MLDFQAEWQEQGASFKDLYPAVNALQSRYGLHPVRLRPRDPLSLRQEGDRSQVQDLFLRFRRLPEEIRRRMTALHHGLARLLVVTGDFESAHSEFQELCRVVSSPVDQAVVQFHLFLVSLELQQWDVALEAYRIANLADERAVGLFPSSRFDAREILGAGARGVTFRCLDRSQSDLPVVVKAFWDELLDQDALTLLREARLHQLVDQPGLAQTHDAGFAGTEWSRFYEAREFIKGETLHEVVLREGPFTPDEWLVLGWSILRGLQAMHGRMLLFRHLSPHSIFLIPKEGSQGGASWEVKLVGGGPALKRATVHACLCQGDSYRESSLGRGLSRWLPYAAPEAVSRPKGMVWIGPHSDLFSFGKLSLFALTGSVEPGPSQQESLPEVWREIIAICTAWKPQDRADQVERVFSLIAAQEKSEEGNRYRQLEEEWQQSQVAKLDERLRDNPDQPELYLQRASLLSQRGEFTQALEDFDEALRLEPADAATLLMRGKTHALLGNVEEAIADLTDARKLDPTNVESLGQRGLVHFRAHRLDEALADFSEGIRHHPGNEMLHLHRGQVYLARKEYRPAIADFSEVLRIHPNNADAFLHRGRAFLGLGEPLRAEADFTRSGQLDPGNVEALRGRASSLASLGKLDRAIEFYSQALERQPSPWLFLERGQTFAQKTEHGLAVDDFSEGLKLDSGNRALLFARCRSQAELNRLDDALADLDVLLAEDPGVPELLYRAHLLTTGQRFEEALDALDQAEQLESAPEIFFQRGNTQVGMGDLDSAISSYSKALDIDSEHASALTNRANCWHQLGHLDLALTDYRRALELQPDDTITLANRAGTYIQQGEWRPALVDLNHALLGDPGVPDLRFRRAQVYLRLGNISDALADLDFYLTIRPDDPHALLLRGTVLSQTGKRREALADFNRVVDHDPSLPSAHLYRGQVHLEEKRFDEAATDFAEAIRLRPDDEQAFIYRGQARQKMGLMDGARADFSTAILLQPDSIQARLQRSHLLAIEGDWPAALADIDRVLEQDSRQIGARITRGRILSLMGKEDQALVEYLSALELAPNNSLILNNLAWQWATASRPELRDPGRAVEFALRSLVEEEDAMRLDTLAAAYASAGRFGEAVITQKKAIDLAEEHDRADYATRLALYEKELPYHQENTTAGQAS